MKQDTPFQMWRPHPWHGLEVGPEPPGRVHAYIEICPFDLVKYEIDKETGYLIAARPQRTSSQPPTLYGFIPRTYAGKKVSTLMEGSTRGDGDPLDICVVSERPISRGEILLNARVVGGIPMLDNDEADDKIVGILENDPFWSDVNDISKLPPALVERLQHYFLTYKLDSAHSGDVSIGEAYSRKHALEVIKAGIDDYQDEYKKHNPQI
jgi:inorganic pyrophosphatase